MRKVKLARKWREYERGEIAEVSEVVFRELERLGYVEYSRIEEPSNYETEELTDYVSKDAESEDAELDDETDQDEDDEQPPSPGKVTRRRKGR